MLLGRLKTEIVIEVFCDMFDIGFGYSWEDIILSIWLFETLKIFSQEVLWSQRILGIETLSSGGAKHIIRFLM